jgi:hypothetical protein
VVVVIGMPLVGVQAGFVLALLSLAVAAARHRRRFVSVIRRFFLPLVPAPNLGLLRILIFTHLLRSALSENPAWYAGLPAPLLSLPLGWGWLHPWLPPEPAVMQELQVVCVIACGLAIVGLFTRVACTVAAASALLVLGLPNFYVKINHGNHLAELIAILLSFSPCGDALSIDQLVRRVRGAESPPPSARYGLPTRLAMLLLATTYLFPGLWKLWESGDLWLSGAKIRVEMINKWADLPDYEPSLRVVDSPVLCAILGTSTLVFEVGFTAALFHRLTRMIAVLCAIAFHVGVGLTMGIYFPWYLPLIGALSIGELEERADTQRTHEGLLGWLRRRAESSVLFLRGYVPVAFERSFAALPSAPAASTWLAGLGLIAMMCVAGIAPFDSWPIGIYPSFSQRVLRAKTHGHLVQFELTRGGVVFDLGSRFGMFDGARSAALARMVLRAAQNEANLSQRLAPLWVAMYHGWSEPRPGDVLTIYETTWRADPQERGSVERRSIAQLQL